MRIRQYDPCDDVTRVSSDNANIAAEHQEPAEVLGDTSTPQFAGSKIVTTVVASLFFLFFSFFLNRCKHKTTVGARKKTNKLSSDNLLHKIYEE